MEQTTPTPNKPKSQFWAKWRDFFIHLLCIAPLIVVIIMVGVLVKGNYSGSMRTLSIVLGVVVVTIITFVIPQTIMFIKHRKSKKSNTEIKAVI